MSEGREEGSREERRRRRRRRSLLPAGNGRQRSPRNSARDVSWHLVECGAEDSAARLQVFHSVGPVVVRCALLVTLIKRTQCCKHENEKTDT